MKEPSTPEKMVKIYPPLFWGELLQMFKKTTAVDKILRLKKRLKVIQGGSSAGKTIAVLLILIDIAQSRKGVLISVVSETI